MSKHQLKKLTRYHRDCLKQTAVTRFSLAIIILTLGLTLSLPIIGWITLKNIAQFVPDAPHVLPITLYLNMDVKEKTREEMIGQLHQLPEIGKIDVFSPAQSAKQLASEAPALHELLLLLPENPLNWSIKLYPKPHIGLQTLLLLQKKLAAHPDIDSALLETEWIHRIQSLWTLGKRITIALGVLLALTFVTILANIFQITLLRTTHPQKTGPILYLGSCYGLAGALLALSLALLFVAWVKTHLYSVAAAYEQPFLLQTLSIKESFTLLIGSALFGLIGAALAVKKQQHYQQQGTMAHE